MRQPLQRVLLFLEEFSASLNNQISTSNSDRMKVMAATREVFAVEQMKEREVFAVEKKILENELQLERDLRLKDKELADTKIYGLALFVPTVGASIAVFSFCFGKT
jgi:hypothetical protein